MRYSFFVSEFLRIILRKKPKYDIFIRRDLRGVMGVEYIEKEFPNGVLLLPEETIDGAYKQVTVRFFEDENNLSLKEIKLWECNCPAQMIFILGKLLTQEKEEVLDLFWEFLRAFIISSWAYQVKIGDLTFSYSSDILYSTNIISWYEKDKKERKIELYKGHVIKFYDEKACEQVVWTLESYFKDLNVVEMKENPDMKFEEYVKRLCNLWKTLLRNRDNTLIKMKMLGKAYRMVE